MTEKNEHVVGLQKLREAMVAHRRAVVGKALQSSLSYQEKAATAVKEIGEAIIGIDAAIADERKLQGLPTAASGGTRRA